MGIEDYRNFLFNEIIATDPSKNNSNTWESDLTSLYYSMINSGSIARPSRFGLPFGVAASTNANNFSSNINARSILKSWYAALGNRKAKRANVICLGDSITLGYGASAFNNRWVTLLASNLRSRLGVASGGRGYIGAVPGNGSGTFTWPATATSTGGSAADYGLKRDTQVLNTGNVVFNLNGTSADIVYPTDPSYGSFTWKVDAGAPTTITPTATRSDGTLTRVSLGSAGSHTLTITGVSNSYLDGVIEYNGDENSGIMVHDAGHGGYKVSDWLAGSYDLTGNWPHAFTAIGPDLLVITLGANDNGAVSADTFRINLNSLISRIRTFLPNVPIILSMPQGANWMNTSAWTPFIQAMVSAALTDGKTLVFDISSQMSNYNDTNNYNMWYDSMHPSDIGHQLIADRLTDFLLP